MKLSGAIILLWITDCHSQKADLPICPQSMQMFPNSLPMHCVMPKSPNPFPGLPPGSQFPPMPFPYSPFSPGFPQAIANYSLNNSYIPFPSYQSMPFSGGPMSYAGSVQGPSMSAPGPPMPIAGSPMAFPGQPTSLSGPPLLPLPAQMAFPAPMPKLPVVVMPYYAPKSLSKNKEPQYMRSQKRQMIASAPNSEDDSENADEDSSEEELWRGRRSGYRRSSNSNKERRRDQNNDHNIIPVLSYITKDGRIIYQKKISDDEAINWLKAVRKEKNTFNKDMRHFDHSEESNIQRHKKNIVDETYNDIKNLEVIEQKENNANADHKQKIEKTVKHKTKAFLGQKRKG